jgi:hypothetical protein
MTKSNRSSIRVTSVFCLVAAGIICLHPSVRAMRLTGQSEPLTTASQAEIGPSNDPAAILATARIIYVCSRTLFVKSEVIENELLKREDFQQAGLLLTKNPRAADLTMEVRRSNFTTEYPYVVVDSRTKFIVASGRVNSLFGTAAGRIANGFMKQVQKARASASARAKS